MVENLILPDVVEMTLIRKNDYKENLLKMPSSSNQLLFINRPCNPDESEVYLQRLSEESHLVTRDFKKPFFSDRKRDELTQQRDELTQQRDEIVNSTIWKLTNPLRKAID